MGMLKHPEHPLGTLLYRATVYLPSRLCWEERKGSILLTDANPFGLAEVKCPYSADPISSRWIWRILLSCRAKLQWITRCSAGLSTRPPTLSSLYYLSRVIGVLQSQPFCRYLIFYYITSSPMLMTTFYFKKQSRYLVSGVLQTTWHLVSLNASTWSFHVNILHCHFTCTIVPWTERVESYKYLGLLTDSLSWSPHIVSVYSKAMKVLGLLYRRIYRHTDSESLKQLYLTLIRPHLDYASQVWDPHLTKDKAKLEKIQKLACRLASCRWDAGYHAWCLYTRWVQARPQTWTIV